MALLIDCGSCRGRKPARQDNCPVCGSADVRFIVDYRPGGREGKRVRIPLPAEIRTCAEATALEQTIRNAGTEIKAKPRLLAKDATVADLFPDYLVYYEIHRAKRSHEDLRYLWDANLKPLMGLHVVRDIRADHLERYQRERKKGLPLRLDQKQKSRVGKVVSNRTVNKELDYFTGFLSWCRQKKKIDIEPIEYEKLPYARPLPVVLTPDEVTRIIDAAESEPLYRTYILCLYTMGLRWSEARFLRLCDFDFPNKSVRVKQKGGTEKILPVNDQVIDAVKSLAEMQGSSEADFIFTSQRLKAQNLGGPPRPIYNGKKAINRICKAAGVTKKVTPHLFRHSIATHLLGADVNARTIQQYLGHAQLATVQFYTHVALGHLRSALDKVQAKKDVHKNV